ncbi:hypothetical protein [Brevundimonas sp.]|uniref:hypothetical protein n=1 Tax=Brevundimonas sp. TaxID=1871086 RepID=UPI0028AF1F69|nr:hypothetical protein [Brevundimonas sp.]
MIALFRTLSATGKAVVAALTLIAVLCFVMAVLTMCSAKTEARKADAGQTLAQGRTRAAQDANAVRDGNDAANQSTRDQVKEDQDALRRETDPAVRDADARRRLCVLNPGACAP